jgi:hypothetical protein
MKRDKPAFSRPLAVKDVPASGRDILVEATARERAQIARELTLPAVDSLVGNYHVSPTKAGARISGEVVARVHRVCVVSLEPFAVQIHEPVEMDFALPTGQRANPQPHGELVISPDEDDPPELLLDGKIDLGAVTFEFLALGLDPYPRKEGAEFSYRDARGDVASSPFSVLAGSAAKATPRE